MDQKDNKTKFLADEETGPTGPSQQRAVIEDLTPLGAMLGDYRIIARLGQGGFGSVYEVEDTRDGQRVAMKVLHQSNLDDNAAERFSREVDVVRRIEHPNVITIYRDGVLDSGLLYYTMELLRGQTLRARVNQTKGLSPEECLDVFEPLCDALEAAHGRGIVHRDLKVSNIFLAKKNGERRVVLLDFGIAKILDEDADRSLTQSRELVGTLSQMAPEQLLYQDVDARTDVYALGGLLFRMLTSLHPFQIGNPQLAREFHLTARRPRPSAHRNVPVAIDAVVEKAMAVGKQARYPSAGAFFEALRRAIETSTLQMGGHARSLFGMSERARTGLQGSNATPGDSSLTPAIGVYIGLHVDDDAMDDDAVLDVMDEMVDSIAGELSGSAMIAAVETATEFLYVQPIAAGEESATRRDVLARVREVLRNQQSALDAEPRVRLCISLHVDQVLIRNGTVGGGKLVDFSSWASRSAEGVSTTESFDAIDAPSS